MLRGKHWFPLMQLYMFYSKGNPRALLCKERFIMILMFRSGKKMFQINFVLRQCMINYYLKNKLKRVTSNSICVKIIFGDFWRRKKDLMSRKERKRSQWKFNRCFNIYSIHMVRSLAVHMYTSIIIIMEKIAVIPSGQMAGSSSAARIVRTELTVSLIELWRWYSAAD